MRAVGRQLGTRPLHPPPYHTYPLSTPPLRWAHRGMTAPARRARGSSAATQTLRSTSSTVTARAAKVAPTQTGRHADKQPASQPASQTDRKTRSRTPTPLGGGVMMCGACLCARRAPACAGGLMQPCTSGGGGGGRGGGGWWRGRQRFPPGSMDLTTQATTWCRRPTSRCLCATCTT